MMAENGSRVNDNPYPDVPRPLANEDYGLMAVDLIGIGSQFPGGHADTVVVDTISGYVCGDTIEANLGINTDY
jgi:hypothetical protein